MGKRDRDEPNGGQVKLPKGQKNRIADHRTPPTIPSGSPVIPDELVTHAKHVAHDFEVTLHGLQKHRLDLRCIRFDELLEAIQSRQPAKTLIQILEHAVAEPIEGLLEAVRSLLAASATTETSTLETMYRQAILSEPKNHFEQITATIARELKNLDDAIQEDLTCRGLVNEALTATNAVVREGRIIATELEQEERKLTDLVRTTHRELMDGTLETINDLDRRTREIEDLRDHCKKAHMHLGESAAWYAERARAFHTSQKSLRGSKQTWEQCRIRIGIYCNLFVSAGIDPELFFGPIRTKIETLPNRTERDRLEQTLPEPFPKAEAGMRSEQVERVLDEILKASEAATTSQKSSNRPVPTRDNPAARPGEPLTTQPRPFQLVLCAFALAKCPWTARALFAHLEQQSATGGVPWVQFSAAVTEATKRPLLERVGKDEGEEPLLKITTAGRTTVEGCKWFAHLPLEVAVRLQSAFIP